MDGRRRWQALRPIRYSKGEQDRHHREYFNIDTGKAEKVALDDAVLFTEWAVGHVVDGKFEEIYRYPLPGTS